MIATDEFKKDFSQLLRDVGCEQKIEVIETINENTNHVMIVRAINKSGADGYLVFNNIDNFQNYSSLSDDVRTLFLRHVYGMLRSQLIVNKVAAKTR